MSLDDKYKALKEEAASLIDREKLLINRINEIKKLSLGNAERQKRISALEDELDELMTN